MDLNQLNNVTSKRKSYNLVLTKSDEQCLQLD
jgi:hypothetical protein